MKFSATVVPATLALITLSLGCADPSGEVAIFTNKPEAHFSARSAEGVDYMCTSACEAVELEWVTHVCPCELWPGRYIMNGEILEGYVWPEAVYFTIEADENVDVEFIYEPDPDVQ